MKISIFKNKIKELTPPWEYTPHNIWCPLYMKPIHGHCITGREWEEVDLEDIWTNIINHNRRIRIHKDYVELPMGNTNEFIKIKTI